MLKTNESILTLLDDIKIHLSTLQLHSLNEVFSKIPKPLLQTNVNDIKTIATLRFSEDSNPKSLTLTCDSKNLSASLSKATLEILGLSIAGFLKNIKTIQNTNSNNTLQEAIEEAIKAHHKRFLEDQLSHTILQYAQLYEKVRLLNPTDSKEEIFARLDNRFHNHFKSTSDSSNQLTSAYYDFINAYQMKKVGFFTCFGDEKDDLAPHSITQKLIKNSEYELTTYLNIIHTIEKLPIYLQNKATAEQLVDELKHLSDNYFSNLLKINSLESTIETKRNERMDAFEKFRINSYLSIKRYKDSHPQESIKATNFLHKLLWLITKLLPLISTETRMMMFKGHTKASISFENINQIITKIAPAA